MPRIHNSPVVRGGAVKMKCPRLTKCTRFLFVATLISQLLSGCSFVSPHMDGEIEATRIRDTLYVSYDVHSYSGEIDSIALQLLPGGRSTDVVYAAEERVKDSLYKSLGDSIPCCRHYLIARAIAKAKGVTVDSLEHLDGIPVCWGTEPLAGSRFDLPFSPMIVYPVNKNAEVFANTDNLDSLRRISVPCSWAVYDSIAGIDRGIREDSVLFRMTADRNQAGNSSSGVLRYFYNEFRGESSYCLKVYGVDDRYPSDGSLYYPAVWRGVLPNRPEVNKYQFEDRGRMLGMMGGVGIASFDIPDSPHWHFAVDKDAQILLSGGILYYMPSAILGSFFELYGMSDSASNYSGGNLQSVTPLSVRYYPGSKSSYGASFYGGIEYASHEYSEDAYQHSDKGWGVEIGTAYESYYDRLAYSYHTEVGGFHEFELLLGMNATQKGKAGFKLTYLHGPEVRFAGLQAYMENRFFSDTLEPHRPRSRLLTVALWAGMAAGWMLIH